MANISTLKPIKQGEVRNPKGSSKKARMRKNLREILQNKIDANEKIDQGIEKLLEMASQGDKWAIEFIFKYDIGKPIETVRTQEVKQEPIKVLDID